MENHNQILLQSAISYAKRGWLVFPLKPKTKVPATKDGFKSATTDIDQIKNWWGRAEYGIGLACGKESGFFVLDIDQKTGGTDSLEVLERQHGRLPNTVESITGGGGRHIFFAIGAHADIFNSAGKIGVGIDVRGEGGYVAAPPTLHESGRLYEWELSSHPDDVPLFPAPEWLITLICADRKREPSNPGDAKVAIEGQRNSVLTSLAGSMRRMGMSEESMLAALTRENEIRCAPPLPQDEVAKIAHSISRYDPSADALTPLSIDPHGNKFALSDTGNAKRLIAHHGKELRFVSNWNKWLIWDGMRWQVDELLEVQRRAKRTVAAIYAEASAATQDGERKAIAKWASQSESLQKQKAMIESAQSEPMVAIEPSELDSKPWLISLLNGTLDLKSGQLHEHRRKNLITKLVKAAYLPAAQCPNFEKFLMEIMGGNKNLVSYLQRAIGYSLTGDCSEQCLFLAYGTGANGKSTLFEVLRVLLGDYSRQTPFETFLSKDGDGGPRNDLARLVGTRFVTAVEASRQKSFDEAALKQLTGGDMVTARFLHREFFEYKPQFKIWLSTNHKPRIHGSDNGIWRRLHLIPFNVTFPVEKQNRFLGEQLRMELPGILRWAIDGCREWLETGLNPPREVLDAVEEYRSENDVLGEFISTCCVTGKGNEITSADLYRAYENWAQDNKERVISKKSFGTILSEKGFMKRKSDGQQIWIGIRIKDAFDSILNNSKEVNEEW